ncbi:unnamed protein product [Brachionus calyciflorus]|uniref:CAP-Gly domain-containing protein n=1 Tax=Brachionus calyciflorus TaxID=104777 RepID=A0A814LB60_9BILA|nr:unnamed protein product [Brachionus calyciflorus]
MSEFQVVTQSYVNLTTISEGREYGVEKRYPKDIKIIDFKNKLEMMTGFVSSGMTLRLLNKDRQFLCEMNDDDRMLGFYPCEDGYYVEVVGSKTVLGIPIGEIDPNVQKFELTDEEYAKKRGTIKEFKQKLKLGQYSDQFADTVHQKEREKQEKLEKEKSLIGSMSIGSRCKVSLVGHPTRLGTVMYTGELTGKPGYFVGVKYDEPLGKNDGSVDGKRYFQCSPNYGGFVKPENVECGDFPEEDFDEL